MSKTVGSILLVAAAIAVNVIPGAGQALSGVLAGLATSITTAGVLAGLSLVGGLLGLTGGLPKPDTADNPIKQPRPPRVSGYGISRLYGAYILYETASNGTAVDVYAVHDGKMDGVVQWYLGDDKVTVVGSTVQQGADKRYKGGAVHLYWTDGSSPGAALPAITSLVPDWTSAHRGDGVVIVGLTAKAVKQKDFSETYPSSQVPVPSLAARWQLCPDPTADDPSDEAGWTWTENPVRQLMHYKLVRESADYATKIEPALDSWIAAAADCDDATPLKAGGTEPRYRSCVAHKHTDAHKDVTAALLATFDGWIAPRPDGALQVYSGRFYEPTVDIGPDQIVSYTWDGVAVDDDKAVNEVIVGYVSAEHDYATVEADAWRDEDDIDARGQVLSQPLDAQVPSHAQARRLAKRKVARVMALNRGSITTTVAGRAVRGHRYINLRIVEAGATFYDGPAEITGLVRNMATGGVTFSWVAADPNVDAWNPATEEGEPAAKGDRVAADALEPPSIDSATTLFETSTDAGTGVRIDIEATGPDRNDLTWYARWRKFGAASWNEQRYDDQDPGPAAHLLTGFVPSDADVEVEVAYGVADGRVSPYSDPVTADTATDTSPPEDATSITLDAWEGSIDLSAVPVGRASSYRWRFYGADGTTLIRTITTSARSVVYSAAQARADGIRRSYVVKVAGVNSAGAGAEVSTGVITKAAPAAVGSPAITGGATDAAASCTAAAGAAGYVVFYSGTSGFDPLTSGGLRTAGGPSIPLYGLPAGTFYGRIAAFDAWTYKPDLLNLSAELSFTITSGGGSTPPGDGPGGGGFENDPPL